MSRFIPFSVLYISFQSSNHRILYFSSQHHGYQNCLYFSRHELIIPFKNTPKQYTRYCYPIEFMQWETREGSYSRWQHQRRGPRAREIQRECMTSYMRQVSDVKFAREKREPHGICLKKRKRVVGAALMWYRWFCESPIHFR